MNVSESVCSNHRLCVMDITAPSLLAISSKIKPFEMKFSDGDVVLFCSCISVCRIKTIEWFKNLKVYNTKRFNILCSGGEL